MSTSSETDEFGGTTWWVDEDGGRARIDRRKGWPHYLVTCHGVTRLIAGDDFGRAHDAALAAIHATRGEAQPEGDGWEEVEPDVWRWSDGGEYSASVCRVDADLAARHGHGVWVWDARHDRLGRVAEGECHTLDEAKRFAAAQARPVRSTTQPEGDGWVETVPGVWQWSVDGSDYNALVEKPSRSTWAWTLFRSNTIVAGGDCSTREMAQRRAVEWCELFRAHPLQPETDPPPMGGVWTWTMNRASASDAEVEAQPEPAPSERERIAAVERERDELRALLDEINREDTGPGEAYGCGSHSCVVERPRGQGNNGGCRCSRGTLRRALRRERERTAAAVEAEREACAAVADRLAEINATARSKVVDPSNAAVREVEARIETADLIAQAIRARKDGAK